MEEQKQQIINTAFGKFCQYGIKSVSIDDICRELGMSKKTFYVYFPGKDELVKEVLIYMHKKHQEEVEKVLKGKSALECVRKVMQMQNKMGDVHKEPPLAYDLQKYYPAIYQEHIAHVRRGTRDFIMHHLEQGIAEGVYRKDLDVEMCAVFFVMVQQAYISNMNKVHNFSPKRVATFATDTFLKTVLSEEGMRQVEEIRSKNNK